MIGSLRLGGTEGQLLELLQRLDRSRLEPSLVLFEGSTAERASGLVENVFHLGIPSQGYSKWWGRGWKAGISLLRLAQYFASSRPDIVHAFLPAACILACPAARLVRVPIVIGSRRSLVDCYRSLSQITAAADRFATRQADFMLGNCSAVTREIIELDGFPEARTRTIYNGVDAVRFSPRNDRSWRARMGWNQDHVVYGLLANFHGYKRHVDFVRAAAILVQRFPQARFVMAGKDQGTMPFVRDEIARLHLAEQVTVLPGIDDPEKLFAAIDVYVCASETEGFSNVLLEAMASGHPVIATRVGGNPEAVIDNENGFLVPPCSPNAIAAAAAKLLCDPALRGRMGVCSRERIEHDFSITRMVENYDHFYRHLLGSVTGAVHA